MSKAQSLKRRWLELRLRVGAANALAAIALLLVALAPALVGAGAASTTWSFDMYDSRAVLYQDPDLNACSSAAAEIMLNLAAYQSSPDVLAPGNGVFQVAMRWQPDTSSQKMEAILAYERANMTMLITSPGTDPHGWRNALNYFGWGWIRTGIYVDSAYASFDSAAKAVVAYLARSRKPVGILAGAGRHAQVITGYVAVGEDPAISDSFSVAGVYVTDPLRTNAMRDTWVPLETWRSGSPIIQFSPYMETDSPYQDPIDGNVGTTEWYGKWVIIDAAR
jgi:hypothetical protein